MTTPSRELLDQPRKVKEGGRNGGCRMSSEPKLYHVDEGRVCVVLGGKSPVRSYIQVRTADGTFETVAEAKLTQTDIDAIRRCEERFLAAGVMRLEDRKQRERFEELEIGEEFYDTDGRRHKKIDTDKALTNPQGPWITLRPDTPVRRVADAS